MCHMVVFKGGYYLMKLSNFYKLPKIAPFWPESYHKMQWLQLLECKYGQFDQKNTA